MSRCAAALLTAFVTAALTTACAKTVTVGSACGWENAAPAQSGASATVVLVDDTASFLGKKGQQVSLHAGDPARLAADALLRKFESSGTQLVSFGTFDGSSATVNWMLSHVALPAATGGDAEVEGERADAQSCLTGLVKSALANTTPQAPGTDVMAALAAAGQQLRGTPAAADRVVLVTDGLSNVGCLNLNNVISQGESVSAVLGSCPERADLALLHGVSAQLDGVGYRAGPPLSSAEQAWVENYWMGVCTALGVASAGSCVAVPGSTVTLGSAVSRPADPAIVFPSVPHHAGSVLVPADLLFAFDSDQLSAAGQAYLGILAQELKTQRRSITRVVGHTDAVGTAQYNLGLSRRRAQAVAAYLAEQGFRDITTDGVGESNPACSPQYTSAGKPIEPCMARDRRVQIFLGG